MNEPDEPSEIGIVFAQRVLELMNDQGASSEVTVCLGVPLKSVSEIGGWYCPIEILGFPNKRFCCINGEDSLQAVVLALIYCENVLLAEAKKSGCTLVMDGFQVSPVFGGSEMPTTTPPKI